ncbi:hypothetical protein L3Q72_05285 [Vibrio sp. JC009]|uniref:CxC ATPase DNA modification system associated small protein n=1 Tax=Vibrio sp. JC009 TaxID=2912314 RepID=UPI0023AE6CF9|nr:CxC ATPase DNA modification system associated small protein [Vibrio sp. JC009]WED22806.1 hypothetical protein L3Q72_05285 [Vibrio sp. JC009]
MDLAKIKAMLEAADKETADAHHSFSDKSSVHAAALQIMQFEKDLHYGDIAQNRHLQKIREIIESYMEEINNETAKN